MGDRGSQDEDNTKTVTMLTDHAETKTQNNVRIEGQDHAKTEIKTNLDDYNTRIKLLSKTNTTKP